MGTPTLISVSIGLLVVSAIFWVIERLRPSKAVVPRRSVDTRVDLVYWFFTPLVTRTVTRLAIGVAFVLIARSQGLTLDELRRFTTSRQTWASSLPIAAQVPLIALAAFVPVLTFYALFLHADVSWSFGPLRYVIASPVFHRWHHTSEEEGLDRNFAGMFPVIDVVFGTFYMPAGREPERFGIVHDDVPDGLLAQLAYPFRRPPSA